MDFPAAQEAVVATQCPYSTTVPDDPDMPGVVYATGTTFTTTFMSHHLICFVVLYR
jgi:hypothetical protein